MSPKTDIDTFRIAKGAIETPIAYKSNDSVVFDLKQRKVYLYGNANVKYEDMELTAALIVIDFKKREMYATGRIDSSGVFTDRPHFDDGERPVDADTMVYNFDTKRGRTYGVRLTEGDGYILCNKVFRDDDKNIYSDRGQYTTCNLDHPHFYLQTRKLKIIPDNKIVFGPSNLVIEDIPTPLYLPFGMFPTKKGQKSGIIPPEYGVTGVYGPYLRSMGYFFAISDKLDQAVRGDFYFRGSWGLHSDTRYASRYHYRGSVSLGYSQLLPQGLEREDPGFKEGIRKTFEIRWEHIQDMKARPGTSFNAKVNMQKGRYSQLNSVNPTQIVANTFNSSVTYSKVLADGKVNITTGMIHAQNTQNGDFSLSLPTLTVGVMRITPFARKVPAGRPKWYENIGFSYQMDAENTVRTKDSLFFEGKAFDQFQNGINHSLPLTFGSFKVLREHISITPTFSYREVWYNKTMTKTWNSNTEKLDTTYYYGFKRGAEYSGSINATTQVFGTYQFGTGKKISAMRHVMSPSLGVSFSPDFTDKKFGYYYETQVDTAGNTRKFSIFEGGIKGGPTSRKTGSINFGLGNNFQAKMRKHTDSTDKYENVALIENITLSGNYNFLADSFRLSNISVSGFTTLFKQVRLNAGATLDPYHTEGNRRMNQLEIIKGGRIGVWRSANISLTTDINADMFRSKKKTTPVVTDDEDKQELLSMKQNPSAFADFSMPWSFGINASMQYSRNNYRTVWTPTLSVRGDFNVTPNWKVNVSTGYDFTNDKIAYTQFNVTRNLHCWMLDFQWIPDGIRKSFSFTLRVNSSMLQDLKVNKRRLWYDQ